VSVADFQFTPATLTVEVGDTVVWTFDGSVAHTTTATGGQWDSGTKAPGTTYAVTFTAEGTFPYLCTIHPSMTGTITVTG
jgi:plastocyanin